MKLGSGTVVTANGLTGRLYAAEAGPDQSRGESPSTSEHGPFKPADLNPAALQHGTSRPGSPKRDRPVFVLLHGIGVTHRYFAKLHLELSRGKQAPGAVVYSFDLPGFGDTPRPGRQVSVGEYAAFVAAVLAEAGVQSCVVVGHSMGTQFAVELALQEPDLVSGVVLMGPVVDPSRRSATWHALALTRDSLLCEAPTTNAVVFTDYFRTGLRWYFTQLPVMLGFPLETRIRGVQQPVLVLRGGRDPIARRPWCEYLAAEAPHGTFAEVPARGHVVQDTAPSAVAHAIARWAETTADGLRGSLPG
ncbi:alpha/beta fold hydrolase [Arthrobacter sp. ZGTC131]|uniref:alpha/beta fold hydrolase n=1 Tax=Arthrobacter sp. ZGTC131 TaxID=2058898 RepID=UPI000CE47C15|nr:alpha/beta hydrolase [Arthrobacter sp. ZGTC131]